MDTNALLSLLASEGYEVRFRREVWVECLLLRRGESWLGRGPDDASALIEASKCACPSQLAQSLLERALANAGADTVHEPPQEPAAKSPTARVTPELSGKPILVERCHPPKPELGRALDDLTLLEGRIRESREELGLSAPELQRMAMLSWICEARAHTDVFPDEPRVRDQVANISRQLTEIGKAFWPGSVTALQLQMSPRDLPRPVLGGSASTWGRAAELASRALSSLAHADERRGLDHYGWADAARFDPLPASPEPLLDRLVAAVEAEGGALDRSAEAKDADARPDAATFLRWVRTLRWLRVSAVDPDRWGRVAGRLRWWASRRDPKLQAGARELDPVFAPSAPWAALLAGEASKPGCPITPPAALLTALEPRLAGRRILFVTFRRDPELQARIQQTLRGARIDWFLADPQHADALAPALAEPPDLVIAALGLQAPEIDQFLARACRSAAIPYVRANWGRPLVCARALARALACPSVAN